MNQTFDQIKMTSGASAIDLQNLDQATEMQAKLLRPISEILLNTKEITDYQIIGSGDVLVNEITHDSKQVKPNSVFCCVMGERSDGHAFAKDAIVRGAVVLLVAYQLDIDVTQIVVGEVRSAMGYLAAEIFGRPSSEMNVIGITGTNGKTTTAHLLAAILDQHGWPTEVFGTLTGVRTTPESPDLQRALAEQLEQGSKAVVMEVSSHALALHRVVGTSFKASVFTNLGNDHLDFHNSVEDYFSAKAQLFNSRYSQLGVVNRDDVRGMLLLDTIKLDSKMVAVDFGMSDAVNMQTDIDSVSFTWRGQNINVGVGGHFNVLNALAAATTAAELGVSKSDIAKGLANACAVSGRFENVSVGQNFGVIVDYAHTPEALENVLNSARQLVEQDAKLIVVFGCGGDRDSQKRPTMGRIAAELGDLVFITSDNPRHESAATIADEIYSGVAKQECVASHVSIVLDRRSAIANAISSARSGDVIVIAGKGHESTQTIGGCEFEFNDADVSRELLRACL